MKIYHCERSLLINLWILLINLNFANSNSIESENKPFHKSRIAALKSAGNNGNKSLSNYLQLVKIASVAIQTKRIYNFSDIFTKTFYDTKYDNVVFVTKAGIESYDEVLEEYKTIVQSSETSMIRYSVLNIRYLIMTLRYLSMFAIFYNIKSS